MEQTRKFHFSNYYWTNKEILVFKLLWDIQGHFIFQIIMGQTRKFEF